MNGTGVRPNKLWHWAAIGFLVATFLAEPRASMTLTWQLFRGAGAIGGELLTGQPEPDVLNLQPDTGAEAGPLERQPDLEHEPLLELEQPEESAPPTDGAYVIDGDGIRSVLDTGTAAVVALHREVTDVQTAGGFNLQIGTPDTDGGGS